MTYKKAKIMPFLRYFKKVKSNGRLNGYYILSLKVVNKNT